MTALESILSQEVIQRLGWTLLHFVWQAAAAALLLAIMLAALRKASSNLRYTISCLALGLIVLLPVVTMQLVGVSAAQPTAVPASAPVVLRTEQVEEIPMAEMPAVEVPAKSKEPRALPAIPWRQRASDRLEPALPSVVSGWLFGVFALSLWHLGGWTQLQRLRRRMVKPVDASLLAKLDELAEKLGVTRAVQLTESALVQIPTVVGWLRPVILLPAIALTGLSTDQLEAILAHELAHIRRHDYLVNMLQTIVETLGFYHPAVWWVSHRIRAERENCCDDLAVGVSGDRVGYARALASMEEIRSSQSELAIAASGGNLLRRIGRLLGKDSTDGSRVSWIPSAITILLIAAIVIPTTFALTARSETEDSAEFLLDKMLEHRSRVKTLEYVAEYEIWCDPAAREDAIEIQIKRKREKGIPEQQLERLGESMSRIPEFSYQVLRCRIDDAGRRKIELTSGSYDSSGKRTPGRGSLYGPQNMPNLGHPWRVFTGILCKFLGETITAEKQVDVGKLKDGTYRIAFDYRTSRIVAVIDPSKGYTCALRENYDKQGHLTSRATAKYEEIADGVWFPISGKKQIYAPESVLRKSTFKSSQIKINDPAFDFGYVEEDQPKDKQVEDHAHDPNESQKSSTEEEQIDPVKKWSIGKQESSAESVARSPVIAKSPTSPGEDKPIIQVDLRILEIYPPGKIDRETQIAIENLLATITTSTPEGREGVLTRRYRVSGKSARTGEKLTVKELIREAAGAARSVGDSSFVTEDPQATQKLRTMVDLLASRGWVKILLNPTLEVVSGGKAEVSSKQKVPMGKATTPSTQSEYMDVIDYLRITPKVLDDGNIMLSAEGTFTRLSAPKSEGQAPGMIETSISTQARIIGGMSLIMYGKNKPGKNTKIDSDPNAPAEQAGELLFILTPTIVGTVKPPDKADREQEKRKIEGETQRQFRERMETDRLNRLAELMQNAHAYLRQQRYEEAVGQLKALLTIDPEDIQARQIKEGLEDKIWLLEQLDEEDARVHKRLEDIVDLPDFSAEMPFGAVIEDLENTFDPPLQIQPNWRDLRETVGLEQTTPVRMDPLRDVKFVGEALEILLAGVSSESTKVSYVVDGGVIVIATTKELPQKMMARVYYVTDLIDDPDDHGGMSPMMQANNLVRFIQKRVESESWYDINDAGEGTATPYPIQHPTKLAIFQTPMNHRAIQRLLEKVRSGAESVPAEFPRQMTILGRCVDSAGRPLSDTRVLVFSVDDTAELAAESRTYFRGQFRLGPVASLTEDTGRRRYLVFVPADGHGPAWKRIYSCEQTVSPLNLKTYESAEVSGTIVTEDSEPVAGAQVWVRQIVPPGATEDPRSGVNDFFTSAPLPGWSSTTDSDGAFRIAGVPDGARIQLFVSHGDFAGSLTYVKPGKDVVINVQPAAVVTGRVLYTKTGKPAAGVKVQAQGVEHVSIPGGMMVNWAKTVTDDQGQYKLESLGGNRYNIWAQAEGFTMVALDSFKVETGQTQQAPDLLLIEGGFITGRVVDEATGKPVKPGAASDVSIHGPSRPDSGAAVEVSRLREDGSFRIRVAPGQNRIYLRPGDNWRREEATVTPASRWVEVAEDQTVEVEFKIRKYSQAELEEAKKRGDRFIFRRNIPKTIDEVEAEYEFQRMSRLASAVALYVREHDETLPNTALELKPYMPNEADLKWALDDVQFVLRGKSAQPNTFQLPIAYDAALLAKDSDTYALFADFSVRRIRRNELKRLGVYYRSLAAAAMNDRWGPLYVAMKTYAKGHNGKLPDTLDALKPYVVSERCFQWIMEDLKYLSPGRHLGLMQNWAPIACEKEPFANDGFTSVLFSDGHLESMYPSQIKKLVGLDRRVKDSAEKLMSFGRAMRVYANDHDGKYPDRVRLHELREYLKDEIFARPQQPAYLAGGRTTADRPDIVIYYDIGLEHYGKGTNVLFNDGHVEFAGPERLSDLNINKTSILIKTQILTVADDFLKDVGLDANSVRTSEIWSEHLLADSAAEPNSQPYRLILDELNASLLLKAIRAHEGTKMLAAPQVSAADGRQARMKAVRDEYYFPTPSDPNDPSGRAKPKPEPIEVGMSVRLTPDALADTTNVRLDFEWELRQLRGFDQRAGPDKKKHKFPLIAVDNVKTTAVIPEGKTLLIGGKKLTWYVESERSVPILGELPAIGRAFRASGITAEPRTLLIMVKTTVNPKTAPPPLDPDDPFAKKLREKFEREH